MSAMSSIASCSYECRYDSCFFSGARSREPPQASSITLEVPDCLHGPTFLSVLPSGAVSECLHLQCLALSPEPIGHDQVTPVTKDELRAELERHEQRYKEVYGGEVTTYAAQPEPERKPWRKRATVQDQAFKQELQRMEKELKDDE